jgi:proteasome lid subunit RPN8/RPN11
MLTRNLLPLALLVVVELATAQETPKPNELFTNGRGATECYREIFDTEHATLERAVVSALGSLMHTSDRSKPFESAGYVIEFNGKYRSSKPVTQHERGRVSQVCIAWWKGSRVVALYHSHAADPTFSTSDRANAARWGLPSFIGTLRDGWVLSYDPATGRTERVGTIDASDLEAMRFVRWAGE